MAGAQTGVYALRYGRRRCSCAPEGEPQEAAKMMILLSVSGFLGRLSFSYFFSELLGRRTRGGRSASAPAR